MTDLERRVDDMEQYSRTDDLMIMDLWQNIKPTLEWLTGEKGEEAKPNELWSPPKSKWFSSLKTTVLIYKAISACHTLPRKDSNAKHELHERTTTVMSGSDMDISLPFRDVNDDNLGGIGLLEYTGSCQYEHEKYDELNLKTFDYTERGGGGK